MINLNMLFSVREPHSHYGICHILFTFLLTLCMLVGIFVAEVNEAFVKHCQQWSMLLQLQKFSAPDDVSAHC